MVSVSSNFHYSIAAVQTLQWHYVETESSLYIYETLILNTKFKENYYIISTVTEEKGKQKSPGRATSRSRSQPLTPGGREKVTQINVCISNKQMHDKHKNQLPLPQARWSKC